MIRLLHWASGDRAVRLSALLLILMVVGVFEPPPIPPAAGVHSDASAHPTLGEPCQLVQAYPVSFVMQPDGTWSASFAFAGGMAIGHLSLPSIDGRRIARSDAYVDDVQLGSYEHVDVGHGRARITCRVDPTYHFYCPATGAVDQPCLTWVPGWEPLSPSAFLPPSSRSGSAPLRHTSRLLSASACPCWFTW